MSIIRIFLLSVVLVSVFSGCRSGKKAFRKGDYDAAVELAIRRLQNAPNNQKAKDVLEEAFKLASETHLISIRQIESSNDPMKWDKVYDEYKQLNFLANRIQKCPSCRQVVTSPKLYTSEMNTAARNAAEDRYQMGVVALQQKQNRQRAIEAHQHFSRANELVSNYKDSRAKAEEALEFATLRVLIEPVPALNRSLQISHDFFYEKILERLNQQRIPYVNFLSVGQINPQTQQQDWIDHVVKMEFDYFNIGSVYNNKSTEEIVKDSVEVGKVDGKPVLGTVKAKFTLFEKGLLTNGFLNLRVIDVASNRVITSDRFPGEFRWQAKWATYQGDERALSAEQKELLKKQEIAVPSPQFLFESFVGPMYDMVSRKLFYYYRGF